MRLKHKIIGFILIISIIPTVIIAGLSYRFKQTVIMNKEETLIKSSIKQTNFYYKDLLTRMSLSLEVFGGPAVFAPRASAKKAISSFMLINPIVKRTFYLSSDSKQDLILPNKVDLKILKKVKKEWIDKQIKLNKLTIEKIKSPFDAGKYSLLISKPLVYYGENKGIIVFELDIDKINNRFNEILYKSNEFIYILDENDNAILSINPDTNMFPFKEILSNIDNDSETMFTLNDLPIYTVTDTLKNGGIRIIAGRAFVDETDQLWNLKYFTMIMIIITLAVSLTLAYLFFKQIYTLYNRFLSILEEISAGNYKDKLRKLDFLIETDPDFEPLKNSLVKLQYKVNKREKGLQDLANLDGLTKIYNRRYMFELLKIAAEESKIEESPLCIALIDLDNFKNTNDKYGHLFGDEVLVKVSKEILKSIKREDIFGRYGGEEFLLALPNTPINEAFIALDRIRNIVKRINFSNGTNITISVGISESVKNQTLNQLIKEADNNLYKAKAAGKDQVII